jgi:predicted acetyltransferase
MTVVRSLPEKDLSSFVAIVANAYPDFGLNTAEELSRVTDRLSGIYGDQERSLHGLYRDGKLLGGMIFHDFRMNVRGVIVPSGGVGLVAVDLAHKKQKIARDMVLYFLRHYRQHGAPLALLYPFRPDFYHQMGFGYGTKMSQYRIRTASLPSGGARRSVRLLDSGDKQALLACYERYASATHGMIARPDRAVEEWFGKPGIVVAGFEGEGRLSGYVVLGFDKGSVFLHSTLRIDELVYEDRHSLAGLLAFLRTQHDQAEWVVHNTQDEHFHHLLSDPRDDSGRIIPSVYHESNTQGVGLMYRVIDAPGCFRALEGVDFGGQSLRLRVELTDTFLPENHGVFCVAFEQGKAAAVEETGFDLSLTIDVAGFSSLLMGVVPFRKLYEYGLAEIDDPSAAEVLDRLFWTPDSPMCLTRF